MLKSYPKRSLLLFFFIIFSVFEEQSRATPLVLNIYKNQYKAATKNWSLGQDERGIIYCGNDMGLLESDGMSWTLNTPPRSPMVRALAIVSHKTVFTGGNNEIGRWDRDASGHFAYTSLTGLLKKNNIDESFWKIWCDGKRVYFQSFSNIYLYENNRISKIRSVNGFLFLLKVRNEFWVQEINGALFRLKGSQLAKIPGSDLFRGTVVRVILPLGQNEVLVGTSDGKLFRYNGAGFVLWNTGLSERLKGTELNCGIYSEHKRSYFLGTLLNGVYEVSETGQLINHFNTGNSLQNNTVQALFEDYQHNVWVAMDRGLSYILYKEGFSFYKSNEKDAGSVYAATLWNGHLLLGTNQGVFVVSSDALNDPDLFSKLKFIEGTQGQVWSFSKIGDRLYFGHNSGVKEISKGLTVSSPLPQIHTGVFRIFESIIRGRIYQFIVTYHSLYVYDKTTQSLHSMTQIPESILRAETDYLGNIWLETTSHAIYKCRLDDAATRFKYITCFSKKNDPSLPAQIRLFKAGERILLVGGNHFWTYNETRNRLQQDATLSRCFANLSDIKNIVPIRDDINWAITGNAICRFFYDGYKCRIEESYRLENNSLSFVNEYENISMLNDSLSLLCLDDGFATHTLSKVRRSNLSTRLVPPFLEAVKATGLEREPVYCSVNEEASIGYAYNSVTINFTVRNAFAQALMVQYRLKNANVDDRWCDPVTTNSVSYARLPQGHYVFQVRSTDGLGNYSAITEYQFDIRAPWYRSVWAWIFYILLLAGIAYLIRYYVIRRFRNIQMQQLRMLEAEHLRNMNERLQGEIEAKNGELLTQTSFIIRKNELILHLKEMVENMSEKNTQKSMIPLFQKMSRLLSDRLDAEEDWKMFMIQFEQKHSLFFKRLKEKHPELTPNDLRLCACLKLNLDTKDIASLMNLSVRAVENNRYRLRKKIDLKPNQILNEYFIEIE
ncbi:MAG: hypothetical protein Q8861_00665 [Bacteroidota bacterium]|nr:hypothetical protein [Bacteroidota bacterium]MDP4269256.1 hypothetical protein [Bacteroidota bacterium]